MTAPPAASRKRPRRAPGVSAGRLAAALLARLDAQEALLHELLRVVRSQ